MFSHSIKSRIVLLQNGKTNEDKIVYLAIGRRLLYNCTDAIICFLPKSNLYDAYLILYDYHFLLLTSSVRLFQTVKLFIFKLKRNVI